MLKKIISKSIYSNIPVEKEDAIYRAGFIGADHSKTKNQNDTLIDRVTLLSENGTFDLSEWELSGLEYHADEPTACICGKTNLTNRYIMENTHNHIQISVGSSCLAKHFDLIVDKDTLNAMEFAKGSGGKHSWLGAKYDALILYTLGFKRAMNYFTDRYNKTQADKETNKLLKESLKLSLSEFDSRLWHKKLERGKRLLKRLLAIKAKEQVKKREEAITRAITLQNKKNEETKSSFKSPADNNVSLNSKPLDMSNLSNDYIERIKNYFNEQSKYAETTKHYRHIHSRDNFHFISYKLEYYVLAKIGTLFHIFVVEKDEVKTIGASEYKIATANVIDKYFEVEANNIF